MDGQKKTLQSRLENIWELPDFSQTFSSTGRKPHKMKKGTLLFNEGDPVNRMYYIQEGYAKAYRISAEGKDTMNYIVGPGYVLGFRSLLSKNDDAQYSAEAITDLTVYSLSHEEYIESVTKHPDLLVDLLHAYADRLEYTERKLEGFIYSSTTSRVAIFLSDCARRFGKEEHGVITLPFPLTHQKIAEFVGSFRETVTLAINRLESEKVLTVQRGDLKIIDIKRLQDYTIFKKSTR